MSIEMIDKRTPELKLLNIIEIQIDNIKKVYDNFRIGRIDFNESVSQCKSIGFNLTKGLDISLKLKDKEKP